MKTSLFTYIIIGVLLAQILPDAVCFAEQWHTFYWDVEHCREVIRQEGQLQFVSDFFTQFLHARWSAALLYAIPCTLVCMLLRGLVAPLLNKYIPPVRPWLCWLLPVLLCVALAVTGCYFTVQGMQGTGARFKGQMCLVARQDWTAILAQNERRTINNSLELNIHNLALAETGQLQQRLMEQPCRDVNSLFVLDIQSPYVAALLSDIYWSMGEISMSQMYAFEANEKMKNLSPRLLQRLVLTNIVFGHYAVARKYLKWLEKTIFYRGWANHYLQLLSDEAVASDVVLNQKRACIPVENGFPSAQSVVYDLQQIIDNNPSHRPSAEYLGALKRIYGIK